MAVLFSTSSCALAFSNWPWFGRTVTGLYCNRVRIGAERFALKVHSFSLVTKLFSGGLESRLEGMLHLLWFAVLKQSYVVPDDSTLTLSIQGMTFETIPPEVVTDCAQLVKANSIQGVSN